MRKILSTVALCAAGLSAVSASADDLGPATVEIGSRTFLIGQVPWEYEVEENFLPINGVDWVKAIMDADPVMGRRGVVFYLQDERNSLSEHLAQGYTERHFGNTELVPDSMRVEGFRTEVNPDLPQPFERYLYLDPGDDPDWMTTCSLDRPVDVVNGKFSYCLMTVTYPEDRGLSVGLRIYGPPPKSEIGTAFPALAARMVEILTCLDVTEDTPATPSEGHARLTLLRAENPELRNCSKDSPS